jgi:hypothetical protein
MLKDTLKKTVDLTQKNLMKSEQETDFTLDKHYEERINFHMKMLQYYLNEQNNEAMATRNRNVSGDIIRD